MKRRTVLSMSAAALASPMLAQAQAPTVVKWWYHFDNPQASPADLIAKFERENPGIKIQAESIPSGWRQRLLHAPLCGPGGRHRA